MRIPRPLRSSRVRRLLGLALVLLLAFPPVLADETRYFYDASGRVIKVEYPDGNRFQLVMLHFAAVPIGGSLRISVETTEVGYFSRAEIAHMDLFQLNRQRVADAFAGQEAAFVRDNHVL